MEAAVYVLCAAAAVACAALLLRGYGRTRVRLLLWSGLCFVGLSVENVILFVDRVVVPDVDLSGARLSAALIGTAALLFGLVWENR